MNKWVGFLAILLCGLIGCASNGEQVKKKGKDVSQNGGKNKSGKKGIKPQYPEFVKYFQNRVSPSMIKFDLLKEGKIERERLKRGFKICDGAFLIEVKEVKENSDGDRWTLIYTIKETYQLKNPDIANTERNEVEILRPQASLQMPKEDLPGRTFLLLVKLDRKMEGDGVYYSYYWQLYPAITEALQVVKK